MRLRRPTFCFRIKVIGVFEAVACIPSCIREDKFDKSVVRLGRDPLREPLLLQRIGNPRELWRLNGTVLPQLLQETLATRFLQLFQMMVSSRSSSSRAATPKELARTLDVEKGILEGAAARLEQEDMVLRTRSPFDRRSPGYIATAAGRRHALDVNPLMREVVYKFRRHRRGSSVPAAGRTRNRH